jgi:hypothetical protein
MLAMPGLLSIWCGLNPEPTLAQPPVRAQALVQRRLTCFRPGPQAGVLRAPAPQRACSSKAAASLAAPQPDPEGMVAPDRMRALPDAAGIAPGFYEQGVEVIASSAEQGPGGGGNA